MGIPGIRIALAAITAGSALLASTGARAANGAYAVDAADISDVGSCKVESWISTATNTDFSAVANPSCVANIFKPVELSLLTNRSRSDGDWSTTIAPKAKTNFVPTGIGKFGFSAYAAGSFDALTGVRYRPNEIFSIDVIYGHNITGENASWITLGTTIRFPAPESRPARERT